MVRNKLRIALILFSVLLVFFILSPYQLAFVETGSMTPTIQPNDDIFILDQSDITTDEVEVGDVITFYSEDRARLTTHRVIEKREDGLITRGDDSFQTDQERGDPPITGDMINGKAVELGGSVFIIEGLAQVAQLVTEFRFGIITGLLLILLVDIILPSKTKGDRTKKIVWTPLKIIFYISIILTLTWTGLIFSSSATISGPNIVAQENPEPNDPRYIALGEQDIRTQQYETTEIVPVYTEYQSVSEDSRIVNVTVAGENTINLNYKIGPYTEQGIKSTQFRAYGYPYTLPGKYISVLHNIHPILASFATVSILSVPFLIVSYLIFSGSPIRWSKYKRLFGR